MCTHSKWANEQTLKTELRIPFYLSVHAFFYCYKHLFVLLYLHVCVYQCRSACLCVSIGKHKYTAETFITFWVKLNSNRKAAKMGEAVHDATKFEQLNLNGKI